MTHIKDIISPKLFERPGPGDFCLLCGGNPDLIGFFVPTRAEDFGGKAGGRRIIRYCICERCQKDRRAPERAEKAIRATLTGGGHGHA